MIVEIWVYEAQTYGVIVYVVMYECVLSDVYVSDALGGISRRASPKTYEEAQGMPRMV